MSDLNLLKRKTVLVATSAATLTMPGILAAEHHHFVLAGVCLSLQMIAVVFAFKLLADLVRAKRQQG